MRTRIVSLGLLVLMTSTAYAVDPAANINKARAEITAGNHAAALRVATLRRAIEDTDLVGVRAVLEAAAAENLLDHPLFIQALEFLERSTL